jgi:hypothetical protein
MPRKNYKHSEETKQKIANSNRGIKKANTHMIGNKYGLGRKHTEQAKKKMSEASKGNKNCLGRVTSEETKRKIGLSNKGKIRSLEMRNKISQSKKGQNSGEKAYQWIKDRTKLKTDREQAYDSRYRYWMNQVKNRDNRKCKISNKDCEGRLEAHHILTWSEYPELRYNIDNGITLCKFHHPRKKEEVEKLSYYFQELINNHHAN